MWMIAAPGYRLAAPDWLAEHYVRRTGKASKSDHHPAWETTGIVPDKGARCRLIYDERAITACESTSASRQTETAHHLPVATQPSASDFPFPIWR